jgi:hypothetical protein
VAVYRPVPSDPPWRIRRGRTTRPVSFGRRWAAVAVGEALIAAGLLLVVEAGSDVGPWPRGAGVGLLLVAPFAVAKLSGHENWPLAAVSATAGLLVAFGLLFPVDDLLPTLAVAFGVGAAIALAWRTRRDLIVRSVAVVALGAAAFAAAAADSRAVVWATIVAALPVVALADELARRALRDATD